MTNNSINFIVFKIMFIITLMIDILKLVGHESVNAWNEAATSNRGSPFTSIAYELNAHWAANISKQCIHKLRILCIKLSHLNYWMVWCKSEMCVCSEQTERARSIQSDCNIVKFFFVNVCIYFSIFIFHFISKLSVALNEM